MKYKKPILQIKVSLEGIKPPIWRRFIVRSDTTLRKLHSIIQVVMGWEGYHLHKFEIAGRIYGDPDIDETFSDDSKVTIGSLPEKKFTYIYDFGDNWKHEVCIEKFLDKEDGVTYPVCLEGSRACPPEDCGGIWGYADLLEAVHDPHHEDHESRKEWLGEDFDTEAFDLDKINKKLKKIR